MTDDEQKNIFRKNLLRLLSDKNKNQREVATAINVSPQTFNTWCQGIALPRMGKIQALADYFGVEKSDLIDEKPENTVKDNTYYLNDETAELAQFAFQNPEYKVLFDASRKTKPEDIKFVTDMINRVNGTGSDVDG